MSENIYIKARRVKRDDFLLFVPESQSSEFRRTFAEWLCSACPHPLIRTCVAIDRSQQASSQGGGPSSTRQPGSNRGGRGKGKPVDRKPEKASRHDSPSSTPGAHPQPGTGTPSLQEALSAIDPYDQVEKLNHYLGEHTQVVRQTEKTPSETNTILAGLPPSIRESLSTRQQASISHGDIEDWYYRQHPGLLRHRTKRSEIVRDQKLGGNPAKWTSRSLGQNAQTDLQRSLVNIASALHGTPITNQESRLVWLSLCMVHLPRKKGVTRTSPIVELLMHEHERDREALRGVIRQLLSTHLEHLCGPAGCIATPKLLAKAIVAAIENSAAGNEAAERNYRLIHRVARYNRDIVEALAKFFFLDFEHERLREAPAFALKCMQHILESDVPVLLKFLFQGGKKRRGYIPQRIAEIEPGSPSRMQSAIVDLYPQQVHERRSRKTPRDWVNKMRELVGQEPCTTEAGLNSSRDVVAKHRAKLKLQLPKNVNR